MAAMLTAILLSCDTDINVAPVYETYFTKYYGEDGNQSGVDLAVGDDGTMVMVGTSQSQTNPITRTFIVKVDPHGTVLWERQMAGDNEVPVDVELDSRNDILVVSNVSATGSGSIPRASIRLTRISQSGTGIDSLIITDDVTKAELFGTAVTEITDGSLIVTGYAGPGLVEDQNLLRTDAQDLMIIKVDPNFALAPELEAGQGGEHIGNIVKLFESQGSVPQRFYTLGDSDRPFRGEGFKQAFEVLQWNEFFVSAPTGVAPSGDAQSSSEAVVMPIGLQRGYVLVGSTGQDVFKQIFMTQYIDGQSDLSIRFSKVIPTPRSAEGVSVAYSDEGSMFVLADELQDNNNHDIYLVKLGSDGAKEGEMRFGSIEGDDQAAAVRVLPDHRVAVFGTIELETQKKMMLTLVSPTGTFSE